jgi:hypothetical protein
MQELFEKKRRLEKRMVFQLIVAVIIEATLLLLAVKQSIWGDWGRACFYLLWYIALDQQFSGYRQTLDTRRDEVDAEIEEERIKRERAWAEKMIKESEKVRDLNGPTAWKSVQDLRNKKEGK